MLFRAIHFLPSGGIKCSSEPYVSNQWQNKISVPYSGGTKCCWESCVSTQRRKKISLELNVSTQWWNKILLEPYILYPVAE